MIGAWQYPYIANRKHLYRSDRHLGDKVKVARKASTWLIYKQESSSIPSLAPKEGGKQQQSHCLDKLLGAWERIGHVATASLAALSRICAEAWQSTACIISGILCWTPIMTVVGTPTQLFGLDHHLSISMAAWLCYHSLELILSRQSLHRPCGPFYLNRAE